MALAGRTARLGHPAGLAAARPSRLALAAVAVRHAVRLGPAYRRQLAARRPARPGLPPLLLLSRQPRTQDRSDLLGLVAPGRLRHRPGTDRAPGPGRYAHQTLRASRRGR